MIIIIVMVIIVGVIYANVVNKSKNDLEALEEKLGAEIEKLKLMYNELKLSVAEKQQADQ